MAADVGYDNKGRGRIHTLCYIAENALKPRQAWSSVKNSPFPIPLNICTTGICGQWDKRNERRVFYLNFVHFKLIWQLD